MADTVDIDRNEVLAPIHVVEVNGELFHLRRDWNGRFNAYVVNPEGLERSVGRMQGYVSLKEAWDAIFERTIQPDTREDLLVTLARTVSKRDDALGMQARAAILSAEIPS